jgi:predicted dehydrogenase
MTGNENINLNRRFFLKAGSAFGAAMLFGKPIAAVGKTNSVIPISQGLAMPTSFKPADPVRIGIVGVGGRGTEFVNILLALKGNIITAVCDISKHNCSNAANLVEKAGHPRPKEYNRGERDYQRMCQQEDIDLVITATPVDWHVPVCVEAMKNGKHSATEVHATYKMDECWELVETAEKYQKQCGLLENYCYFYNVLMILKMARKGLLGDLVFAEAGYQHDCRPVRFGGKGELLWRAEDFIKHNGNLYPTHAVGPVAQWLNINRGDKFDYLVSMTTRSSGMNVYAADKFGKNHPSAKQKFMQGDISSTLIKTANGASITLYFDASLPRPFDMIYRVQGTKGIYMGSTDQIYIEGKSPNYEQWELAKNYLPEYEHPLWTSLGEKAKGWSHWGADYLMMYRLVESFRKGVPFELDVYDAATWSIISPLSEKSVANKSEPVDFPDFTRGKWKTNKPIGIIEA